MEEVLDAILDHRTTGNTTIASLRAASGFLPLKVPHVAYADRNFDTPSGKIEFYSSQADKLGLPPLPMHKVDRGSFYPLPLSYRRTLTHFHAFYDEGRALRTFAIALAQLFKCGNPQIMPQVARTKPKGPGTSCGATSTRPWTNSAGRPVSWARRRAVCNASCEKSRPKAGLHGEPGTVCATDVTLQMKDLLAGYAAQPRGLDVMEGVLAGSKAIKHVITGLVVRMNDCAPIPIASVYLNGVGHGVTINHVPSEKHSKATSDA